MASNQRAYLIDLQTAPTEVLERLPRVGPKRAEALIRHRPFASWEEIESVPSLGKRTVKNLKSNGVELD